MSDIGSAIGGVAGLAGSVNSLMGGGLFGTPKSQSGASVTQAADPYSIYRGSDAAAYHEYLSGGNKTDITQMPGYSQFESTVMQPSLDATQRRIAAQGGSFSGNEMADLTKVSQQGYYGFMTDYLNRLATGSGATRDPATAVGLGVNQQNRNVSNAQAGLGGLGQSFGNFSKLFNGGGNSWPSVGATGWDGATAAANDTAGLGDAWSGALGGFGGSSAGFDWAAMDTSGLADAWAGVASWEGWSSVGEAATVAAEVA